MFPKVIGNFTGYMKSFSDLSRDFRKFQTFLGVYVDFIGFKELSREFKKKSREVQRIFRAFQGRSTVFRKCFKVVFLGFKGIRGFQESPSGT